MGAIVETATLTAPDISCGHCVAKVRKAVGELVGVSDVAADPVTKQVRVSFDPNCVSLADISSRLSDAGYPVIQPKQRASTLPVV